MYAVVIAGGSGTRFWPLSRAARPKQLLPIFGDRPMIAETMARLDGLVEPEQRLVVTHESLARAIAELVPDLLSRNILCEPVARNTAPAIALAVAAVEEAGSGDEVIAVLPADHWIRDGEAFRVAARQAAEVAATGEIVVLGVEPTRPETGFGYIRCGEPAGDGTFHVEAFVEKPDRARALAWLADERYLWNAGMLFARADVLHEELAEHLPAVGGAVPTMRQALAQEPHAPLDDLYAALPEVSIDHGVLEKSDRIRVLPVRFGWSDVGHWDALPDVRETDEAGNVRMGDIVSIDCEDCVLVGHDRRVLAAVGLRSMVVVDSEDALLVAPRARVQEVRAVVERLKSRGEPHT